VTEQEDPLDTVAPVQLVDAMFADSVGFGQEAATQEPEPPENFASASQVTTPLPWSEVPAAQFSEQVDR